MEMNRYLNTATEQEIAKRYASGETNKTALAAEYGVSPRTIGRVLERVGKLAPTKVAEAVKQFVVGDLVVGTEEADKMYLYTTSQAVMKVTEEENLPEVMGVEVLYNEERPSGVGSAFWVAPEFFEKIGSIEEIEEDFEEESQTIEIGDCVVLLNLFNKPTLEGYGYDIDSNPEEGSVGTVTDIQGGDTVWYRVQFDNGYNNTYQAHNLEVIMKAEESIYDKPVEEPVAVNFIVSSMAISLMCDGKMQLIDSTHPYFKEVKKYLEEGNYSKASTLMDIKKAIEHFSEGALKIESGRITFRGAEIHNAMSQKIVNMMANGDEGFKAFAKFLAKVLENPSLSTRERLMEFAAAEDIGISPNGDLICYKNVKAGYIPSRAGGWDRVDGEWQYFADLYYDNSVGKVCEMPRSEVDDVDSNTCSHGLHVMSLYYAKSCWGTSGHTMVVEVDPVDFVSIPTDYNNSKARVSRYKVVRELEREELDSLLLKV